MGLITGILYIIKTKSELKRGLMVPGEFTTPEKRAIWILCFANPVIFGAIFYYSFRKDLPMRAKYANQASWWAFFILVFIIPVSLVFLLSLLNS